MSKRKQGKSYDSEEVTNWVVGKEFSKTKLMDLLTEVDSLETISEFGYNNYEQSLESIDSEIQQLNYKKVMAFKLLVSKLIQIINNTDFAIKNKREDMDKYSKSLKIIEEVIINTYNFTGKDSARIKPIYYKLLKIVKKIKSNINIPLYKNNLIYITKDEVDVKEQIEEDQEDFVNNP